MDFSSFNQNNDTFMGNLNRKELATLPAGSYTIEITQEGQLQFKKYSPNYDEIIDLPSPEYDSVMEEVNIFLEPETQQTFKEYNFLYKRSLLLHGLPGTGKTVIVNRVGEKVVQRGGIILFNPDPRLLQYVFKMLDDVQPHLTTMVIFEEFEKLLEHYEDAMLTLLDGQIQKNNIMYLATTNHYELIPERLKRPGRFATIMEVQYPNDQARAAYLQKKLKASDAGEIPLWVDKTSGLSIDELKETVLSVKCLRKPLEEAVQRILAVRPGGTGSMGSVNSEEYDGEGFDESPVLFNRHEAQKAEFRINGKPLKGFSVGKVTVQKR